MVLDDSYKTPGGESLLRSAQERYDQAAQDRRALMTEWAAAGLFLICAVLVAVLSDWNRTLELESLLFCMIAYVAAARVRFPVGSAWTAPTQLVFVPMLFILPMAIVPLVVAACSVLALWSDARELRPTPARTITRIGDSFYSLGPVLVLILSGHESFSWNEWPWLLLAFGAQLLIDAGTGLARTWFAEGISPLDQPQMSWLYITEACLSCVGLTIAAAAVIRPGLVLLSLPLVAVLSMFARERRERLERTLQLSSAYRGAAQLLGDVIDAVDHYTGVHTREVVSLSLEVSRGLALDSTRERDVEFAALLHDVGKIQVPTTIINKAGKLDDAEWAVIHRHTIDGEAMLKKVGGTLAGVGRLVRASHERYDGGGYPDGLVGDAIPIESRIVSVCDAYNAMTTDRPYRRRRSEEAARAELRRCAGTQFDPRVVDALEHVLNEHPDAETVSRELQELIMATGRKR
jgi:HD-GYP domain-containing protein (c-di-GMP phosphodiesterase class II)